MPEKNSNMKTSQSKAAIKRRRQRNQKNLGRVFLHGAYVSEEARDAIKAAGEQIMGVVDIVNQPEDLAELFTDAFTAIQDSELMIRIIGGESNLDVCPPEQTAPDDVVSYIYADSIVDRMNKE